MSFPGKKIFENRKIVIATMHKKEEVISPLLVKYLNTKPFAAVNFNSDIYGTFTGEIERENDALQTARMKCIRAMEENNCDLAIASEGSFGNHPLLPFSLANQEIIVLMDKENSIELKAQTITNKTNFDEATVQSEKELISFCDKVNFPSHAVILRGAKNDKEYLFKGLHDLQDVLEKFKLIQSKLNSAFVETDMRAMHNPTRMKVIQETMQKLILSAEHDCPACACPGFEITQSIAGLPCQSCGMPTKGISKYRYQCQKCKHEKEEANKNKFQDPMYCEFCNP